MTETEIIEIAKNNFPHVWFYKEDLIAFATEIRNRTIQECADVCRGKAYDNKGDYPRYDAYFVAMDALEELKGDEK